MSIFKGGTAITSLSVAGTAIQEVWAGSVQVWSAEGPPLIAPPRPIAGNLDMADGQLDAPWRAETGSLMPTFDGISVTPEGKLQVLFDAGEGGDPGTGATDQGLATPRIVTDGPAGDFDMIAKLSQNYGVWCNDQGYTGWGFIVKTPTSSARFDNYVTDQNQSFSTFCQYDGTQPTTKIGRAHV